MSEFPNIVVPTGTNTSSHVMNGLVPDSYTAQRLKHASPEHLHLTTRRFFIGPVPEGWLNSNRKSWYKRRLDLNDNSSSNATFSAINDGRNSRPTAPQLTPSLAARIQFNSVRTPRVNTTGDGQNEEDYDTEVDEDDEDDYEVQTTAIAPVATTEQLDLNGESENDVLSDSDGELVASNNRSNVVEEASSIKSPRENQHRKESWRTAQEELPQQSGGLDLDRERSNNQTYTSSNGRPSASSRDMDGSNGQPSELGAPSDNIDGSSKTALLRPVTPPMSAENADAQPGSSSMTPQHGQRSVAPRSPAPLNSPTNPKAWKQKAPGVRFKIAENVVKRKQRLGQRAGNARSRVTNKVSRRDTLQEGTVVKMEKMLVRIDATMQQLPDDFDENESIKTETRVVEKWQEFMVVARRSKKQDVDDFRLQLYKTRVIPEIDNDQTRKKPAREIRLIPQSTHVNLYSSLDKTIVIWHPYRKGSRISIMKPSSAAHSVEWYTFLRDALNLHRPNNLKVNVPDLDVALHVERPFEILENPGLNNLDEQAVLKKAAEFEQAVANRIITKSMEMLAGDPEWSQVLQKWSEAAKMGLAWKRYDRLEWIHGINEQRMYGSMAMQHSHDLELRPKQHYPTQAYGKKGVLHEEPAPIEGFLIRLTSQKGLHKRWGKAFFKRLYFSTHDNFLVFNRPAKAVPPHPPKSANLSDTGVPSSQDIVEATPLMYDIEPFKTHNDSIKWLSSDEREDVGKHDAEAVEESRRNLTNLTESDGYINMCQIVKVRKIQWGAGEADEALDSGSEVDFHVDVSNTRQEDGATTEIDDDRTFELVLSNGLVIRLQAYSQETTKTWMHRLRKLIKYWKLRAHADITNLKSTRKANLEALKIDEDQEARIGQFARKWEVSRSEANPELYNMCRLTACRTITMSGSLYRKPQRRSTFQRCSVLLAGGQMLIYQATLRKSTGEQVPHIHQEKQQVIDLKDCYAYSGLIVEDELLYQNRTFDTNHAGMLAATPRVYIDDAWTASDVDVMTCFVVWMNRRKSWFRSVSDSTSANNSGQSRNEKDGKRSKLKRVAQLGVPGRGMVFKCRSRAERDLWVTAVAAEIEAAVEKELCQQGRGRGEDLAEVRLEH